MSFSCPSKKNLNSKFNFSQLQLHIFWLEWDVSSAWCGNLRMDEQLETEILAEKIELLK